HLAWALVMARVSGREDVVFGTVLFGRMGGGEGAERAMGPFMNTLPLRVRLEGAGVETGVRRAHEALAGLLRHEHASLALAQRCSGVQAPAPLFSALLNYRHGTAERDARSAGVLRGWEGIQVIHAEGWTHYPLTLSVDDLGDGFWLTAQSVAPVSPARVCALMRTALDGVLEALETAPNVSLSSLSVLPEGERRQVVEGWNRTDAPFPGDTSVHALFRARAERTPGAVAVVDGSERLTYAELDARAAALANALRRAGAGLDARVAIILPRSLDLVVAELAVLKAGAAYVPLDPSFPAERIAFMVADSGARVVLGRAGGAVPGLSAPWLAVDALDAAAGADPAIDVPGEAPAYVMYTSGSTGQPKGVVVPHRAVARLVINNGYADFGADDRVAFAANPAFDASTVEVWGALLNGGRIVVLPHEALLDPAALETVLREEAVTALFLTTAVFNQHAARIPAALAGVRHLLTGGEAADAASFARVLAARG
ncbi:MAG TPA: AMP-binding protein, partial [Longimicrobium sp.]|nr:AMP-binding protein [Longimicrobium sp.]